MSPEGLQPYENEIKAIEDMYASIWQLHVFLESASFDKQPVVDWILERELKFPNDELLTEELSHQPGSVYRTLAVELRDEFAPNMMPEIVERVDKAGSAVRMRHAVNPDNSKAWLRNLIREVNVDQTGQQRLIHGDNRK